MVIYLSKGAFKPGIIFISAFFAPFIIAITACCISSPREVALYAVLLGFIGFYLLSFWFVRKESESKSIYMEIYEDKIIVFHPNVQNKDGSPLVIPKSNFRYFAYCKITSVYGWVSTLWDLCLPQSLNIVYEEGGKEIEHTIGHIERNEIVNICETYGIKLVMH